MNNSTRATIETILKEKRSKKCCYAKELLNSECSKKIIRAHTISKGNSLKSIMNQDNKVMGINLSFDTLSKNGMFSLKEFGINQASVFTGFCSEHDKELFSEIENKKIIPNCEQMFLLSYRGLCREIYTKSNQVGIENYKKILSSDLNFALSKEYDLLMISLEQYNNIVDFSLSELLKTQDKMIKILNNKEFYKLSYYCIKLESPAKLLTSGAIIPDITFRNEKLFNLNDFSKNFEHLFFNIVNEGDKGYIIFSWIKGDYDHYMHNFIKSFEKIKGKNSKKSDALLRFTFSYFENTFFSIEWWSKLDKNQKEEIKHKINEFGKHNLASFSSKNFNAFIISDFSYIN
ncbi:cytoplasmic protein [Bisgaard Taxon 45]